MNGYREYRYWSPVLGGPVSRVSMWNHHGHEYWQVIPATPAKAYREAREKAVEAINEAITLGLEPGEVHILA